MEIKCKTIEVLGDALLLKGVSGFSGIEQADLYDITIKRHREKRSLDANAYCWVLIDKLAQKLQGTTPIKKSEIYRDFVRNVGGNTGTVCCTEKSANAFCEVWQSNGLGWQAEKCESKIKGCVNVVIYYGSSTFDTAQMSRFINLVVDECKQQGIDTKTPYEIAEMLARWGE